MLIDDCIYQSVDNVPRKRKKFVNYMANSYKYLRVDQVSAIFDLIQRIFEASRPPKAESTPKAKKVAMTPSKSSADHDSDSSEWEDSDDEPESVPTKVKNVNRSAATERRGILYMHLALKYYLKHT